MATIQIEIPDALLEALKQQAAAEGLELNQLAETVLTNYLEEDDFGLPLEELRQSAAESDANEAAGITLTENEVFDELLGQLPKMQKRASA